MPKKTFNNLGADKKNRITHAFLREFSIKPYDEASISSVVRDLDIAKGSIYQYFEDKMDLFMYLLHESSQKKMDIISTIARKEYPDFWTYFKDLYVQGIEFDSTHTAHSLFLHNLTRNLTSPSIRTLYNQLLEKTIVEFIKIVKKEIQLGLFRKDIPVKTLAFALYKQSSSIHEHLEYSNIIDPWRSIEENTPVYKGKKKKVMRIVDHYIELMKSSFDAR